MTAASPAVLAVSGCFHPSYGDGLLCSVENTCPEGWSCNPLTNVCTQDGTGDDGGGIGSDGGEALASLCLGTAPFTTCAANVSTTPLVLDSPIDTGISSKCDVTVTGSCVIAASTIVVNGVVRAFGARPLVLLARDTITVNGKIDVSSSVIYGDAGAGARSPQCAAGTLPGTRGGGAGGSFAGPGGAGGAGSTASGTDVGGAGGKPGAVASGTITTIRAGCPGQPGSGNSAAAGRGGGAVYLIAGTQIELVGSSASILATGEGGSSGTLHIGGDGAGAGGMIGFDAPKVSCSSCGQILASGGGGGEGGGSTNTGSPGGEPTSTTPAAGGAGLASLGGDGGDGSAKAPPGAGASGQPGTVDMGGGTGAGGGGGGGAGLILAPATADLGPNVSPSPLAL